MSYNKQKFLIKIFQILAMKPHAEIGENDGDNVEFPRGKVPLHNIMTLIDNTSQVKTNS